MSRHIHSSFWDDDNYSININTMQTLEEIFYSLDKISDKWEPYFYAYEKHFSAFRNKSPKVLEIGVYKGGSLEMWSKYFGSGSEIIGIDIDKDCLTYKYDGNVKVILGDQSSESFWDGFIEEHGDFDIILDDGGHRMNEQFITLRKMFPHVKNDGIYVCEDTHTSYWPSHGGSPIPTFTTFLSLSKEITDYLNRQHYDSSYVINRWAQTFANNLRSVSFYNSMVVFEKKIDIPWNRVYSKPDK